MKKYVKMPHAIEAEPMTRGAYNEFRGWTIPADENPCDEGYKIARQDGTFSWEPMELFEANHKEFDESKVDFGMAIMVMKQGKKIARKGWNGKGMFVYYVPENSYPSNTGIAKEQFGEMVDYNAYLAIKNVNNTVSTWVPSINDVLAEDWYVVN